jgi:hypothetical protein
MIGAALALLYAVPQDARGGTLGKRLVGLRLSGPGDQRPGLQRALVRNLIRIGPWFLINAWMPWPGFLRALTSSLPGAFYAGSVLTVAFDKPHRAVHDYVAGTRVERVGWQASGIAHAGWRTAALYGAPLLLALLASIPALRPKQLAPLERVMEAVLALPSRPLVLVDDNTFFGRDRKVRTLNVAATFEGRGEDAPAFAKQIAERVRNSGVDLSPYEALHVVARRQAVTGIGYLSKNYAESFPVAGGKASAQPVRNFEKLALEGPTTWSITGKDYETRSWFLQSTDKDGSPGLFYVVEWNCPSCDPNNVTEQRAQELVAPLLQYVCDTGKWQRFSVSSEHGAVQAGSIGVQIADRSVGAVYPHYGIVKKTTDVCRNRPGQ